MKIKNKILINILILLFLILLFFFILINKVIFIAYFNFKNKDYVSSYLNIEKFNEKRFKIFDVSLDKRLDELNILLRSSEFKFFESKITENFSKKLEDCEEERELFLISLYFLKKKDINNSIIFLQKILILNPKNINAKINYEILLKKIKESNVQNIKEEDNYLKQINNYLNSIIKNEGFDDYQKNLNRKINEKIKKNW